MQSWHAMVQSRIFYDLDMKNAQQLQKTLAISIVAFHIDLDVVPYREQMMRLTLHLHTTVLSTNTSPYVQ